MTDRAYRAQNWLLRAEDLEQERERKYNALLFLSDKVNKCISSYEQTGRRDLISAQASHEDLLLTYSEKSAELERITNQLSYEHVITMKVIERLPKVIYRIVLFDRYINHIKWRDMPKLKRYDVKLSQIHNYHREALDALGAILENTNPPEKIPRKPEERRQIKAPA